MIGVVVDLILFAVIIVLIAKRKIPSRRVLLVVLPGRRFNRLQQTGLSYSAIGIIMTVAILIINRFHPMTSHFRGGELGLSEGFFLIGAVSFLLGWKYRRKPENLPPD